MLHSQSSCHKDLRASLFNFDVSMTEAKTARDKGVLLDIDIELTRQCNYRCLGCYNKSGMKSPGELDARRWKDVIYQARQLGAKTGCLLGGEPLLYPHRYEVIDYALDLGMSVLLVTNTSLVSQREAEMLAERKVKLVGKLNSRNPKVQNTLVGNRNAFNMMKESWMNLLNAGYGGCSELSLTAETLITTLNIGELPTLWRWYRQNNITPFFELLTLQGAAIDNQHINVTSEQAKALFADLLEIDVKEFNLPAWPPAGKMAGGLFCDRHYYSCYVKANGEVNPCAGVEVPIGNVKHEPLKDILANSELLNKLRHIDKNIEGFCGECENSRECYGCRGTAFHSLGNPFASDPFCWKNPECVI